MLNFSLIRSWVSVCLRSLGFEATNDIFAENAWYFRSALVRANYNDLKNGVYETTEYLEMFLRNLLLNEKNELQEKGLLRRENGKRCGKWEVLVPLEMD